MCVYVRAAGSGSSLLSPVDNVDMYLSGEMGHHDVLDALERGISGICLAAGS